MDNIHYDSHRTIYRIPANITFVLFIIAQLELHSGALYWRAPWLDRCLPWLVLKLGTIPLPPMFCSVEWHCSWGLAISPPQILCYRGCWPQLVSSELNSLIIKIHGSKVIVRLLTLRHPHSSLLLHRCILLFIAFPDMVIQHLCAYLHPKSSTLSSWCHHRCLLAMWDSWTRRLQRSLGCGRPCK